MVVPTYFALGMALPLVVAALLFGLIRLKSPLVVVPFSNLLHRKPALLRYLVSYGELLFLAVVILGNGLVLHHQYIKRHKVTANATTTIKNFGTALGFVGLFNMVFLALPASRHSFWMEWLNIPFARGVKYHRWLGIATITTLLAHTGLFVAYYIRANASLAMLFPCFDCNIAKTGKDNWVNFFGLLSMLCMVIMGLTSLPIVRRKYYSVFYATHFLFIPATFLAVLHWGPITYFLFATIVLYLVNRIYSSATVAAPVSLDHAVALTQVTHLTVHCAAGYTPGDAVWLKVPALSKTQWHPFSVASTPLHTPGRLTLYIKCLGKWTSGLHTYIQACEAKNVQPIIYMDGGYTPAAPIPSSHSDVVFIGGGIGITPLMGQLLHVLHTNPHQMLWLVWHVRRVDLLVQFQAWLLEIEALAASTGTRLHIRLHVTQEASSSVDIVSATLSGLEPNMAVHDTHAPQEPRPYAHLSTTKRLLVLLLAFACSGAALAAVKYGEPIQAQNAAWWPLQRFVEVVVVVAGAYAGYFVTRLPQGKVDTPTANDVVVEDGKVTLDTEGFVAHFNVQFERAVWSTVFADVAASAAATVGVYVSGPMSLVRAVDAHAQGKRGFHVRHDEFHM
ncbi:Aste57867_4549 [Aphanomyces stellatus]|nr:hypothetical protein As57867_004536 [Aphanomyces stellatus]VFT81655.1 Aste57867_4549 [Aphanomyces stellatus]